MVVVPPKKAPRLFLIDAYALLYRAYYAFINRPLTNSKGENTSAPFGFVNFLISIRDEYEPDYLAVVFDAGNSKREEVYPEYKATREKMPDDMRASLKYVRQLVEGFHDRVVELDGYEADDVIGTLARKAKEAGVEAVIVSGDKDFYQLVEPGVHLMNPGRGGPQGVEAEWVDETNAHEKFGIPPAQVIDYLALIGDSSDNVPGAPGIGPKTAVKLLEKYGSVEEILEHRDEISGKRARESLQENADDVRLSKQLVTIMRDLDVELDLDALEVQEPDRERLLELFGELEFRRLQERFSEPGDQVAGAALDFDDARFRVVTTPDEVEELVARVREVGGMSLEAHGPHPGGFRLVGLSVALDGPDEEGRGGSEGEAEAGGKDADSEDTRSWYLPLGHVAPGNPSLLDDGQEERNLPALDTPEMEPLRALLEDDSLPKTGHDLKAAALLLMRSGIELGGIDFDTSIASYLIDPNRRDRGVETLGPDMLGVRLINRKDVVGTGQKQISFAEVEVERAAEYGGQIALCARGLRAHFTPLLAEMELEELFRTLEMPLVPILAEMEYHGIAIDPEVFDEMSERLERELGLIQEEVFKLAGEEFNLNSTPQLREILFEKLDMPVIKKTKTGPSTDASVLEELATQGYEIPRHLLEYRQLEKLRSTYVDALPKLVHRRTGRIHTSFNQTVAATGRLSSSEPNLQNIPIRTALGREVRKGFVPGGGFRFLAADYSQIELRVMAHFSGDEAFVTAFREGIDVHKQTASVIFDVALDEVTPAMRAQAKTINFATLYGQGDFSLAKQLGISRTEAKEFIAEYFERFSGVREFLDDRVEFAKKHGYVETLSGRRRLIPELRSKNWNLRQFGERVAQNTPIQGTAADLIKQAMIDVREGMEESGLESRMLLQVHDELLFEVVPDELDELRELVVTRMEGAMELSVPLRVDVGVGDSWFDCK